MNKILTALIFLLNLGLVSAQFDGADPFSAEDEDLNIGGDIFSDFNEDIESAQIAEDERFYRYGRLFSIQFGVGVTTFSGNRGLAYEDKLPSLSLGYNYFKDFQNSFGLGVAYSRHAFFLGVGDQYRGFVNNDRFLGTVNVSMIRVFFNFRHYIETANLGTAITYSNPYLTGRMEYWYVSNKFSASAETLDDNGGAFGFGIGGGLDFPVELRESYINVEMLMHFVPYHDIDTANYQCKYAECEANTFEDLSGNAFTTTVSYVINW